jgi:hypothetical protein
MNFCEAANWWPAAWPRRLKDRTRLFDGAPWLLDEAAGVKLLE